MRAVPRGDRAAGGSAPSTRGGRTPIGSSPDELALIDEVARVMRDASICGLGQTAANAVQSAISKLGVFDGGAA